MKTIQMTIDDTLLTTMDQVVRELATNRSAFIRVALELVLRQYRLRKLEEHHAAGYTRHPVQPGEFDVWEAEEVWREE